MYNPFLGQQFPGYTPPGQGGSVMPQPRAKYGVGLPVAGGGARYDAPFGSGVNDPTLAAGASYSGGAGGFNLPAGAIPLNQYGNGNLNALIQRGYRRQLVNGIWYIVPPDQPAGQAKYGIH
jgi:hypothetical protein